MREISRSSELGGLPVSTIDEELEAMLASFDDDGAAIASGSDDPAPDLAKSISDPKRWYEQWQTDLARSGAREDRNNPILDANYIARLKTCGYFGEAHQKRRSVSIVRNTISDTKEIQRAARKAAEARSPIASSIAKGLPRIHPPQWQHATAIIKAHYAAHALDLDPGFITCRLDINLDKPQTNKALKNGAGDFILRRLRERLKDALGRNVDFFIVSETVKPESKRSPFAIGPKALHFHGVINLKAGTEVWFTKEGFARGPAIDAMRPIAGYAKVKQGKARGFYLRASNPDRGGVLGLAVYALKYLDITPHHISGDPLRITRDLGTRAKNLYIYDRAMHLSLLRR